MTKNIFKILYLLIITIFIISWFKIRELPEKNEVVPDLLKQPIQTETARKDFSFSYRGKSYNVKPVADYELWGLVVSINDIGAWYNYYHNENSVNLKDVCVVWGKNVENGVYREKEIDFKSGEWTCYVNWSSGLKNPFQLNNFSNNHLLTADPEIQDMIRNVNIGDQIHIKGNLADYAEAGQSFYRMTSISRDDTNSTSRSGGACEIVYVDKMEVLKKNQIFWHLANTASKNIFFGLMILQIILFFVDMKRHFRQNRENMIT